MDVVGLGVCFAWGYKIACFARIDMRWNSVTFETLGLLPPLMRAIREAGYIQPTQIQCDAIPRVLEGRDVVGCAQTGTGKTAAFALPLLQQLYSRKIDSHHIRALVLTPTRELAAQIGDSFSVYGCYLDSKHTVIFGGVNDRAQIAELRRGVSTIIATPGRLLDLMRQGEVILKNVELFVLDEADRMLDMGFMPDVKRIASALPSVRQTLLFSATMPTEIRALANSLLRNPVNIIEAHLAEPVDLVEQQMYFVDQHNKRKLLVHLITQLKITRALVFSRTKYGANSMVNVLERAGIHCAALHGNKSQNARTRALDGFRRGDISVLVATDLAARGIDVDGITHVINYDLPEEPETYIHRIGRTARAGASGIAMSFCDTQERRYLEAIERLMGQHILRIEGHLFPPSQPLPRPTDLSRQPRRRTRNTSASTTSSHARRATRAAGPHQRSGGRLRRDERRASQLRR